MTRCSLPIGRENTDFFSGPPLTALATLSFSENVDLQRKAALAFADVTEEGRPVDPETLNPILRLLNSRDAGVQEAACTALKKLSVNCGYFSAQV